MHDTTEISLSDTQSLVDVLRWRALHQPDTLLFTFLVEDNREVGQLTAIDLDTQARAVAAYLQTRKAAGERALLFYPQGLDYIIGFLGCLYAGVIAVPAYPPRRNRPDSRLEAIARDANAAFILTDSTTLRDKDKALVHMPSLQSMEWLATDVQVPRDLADSWQPPAISPAAVAYLQYTSGSTSDPKGVMVTHNNIMVHASMLTRLFEITAESSLMLWLPLFHDFGLVYGLIEPIYKGIPGYLMAPASFIQRPFRWLHAISEYGATHTGSPNFAFDLCAEKIPEEWRQQLDLHTLRVAINGSEPIHHETLLRFHETFASQGLADNVCRPGYGLAEATLAVTCIGSEIGYGTGSCYVSKIALENGRWVKTHSEDKAALHLVSCGKPAPETTLRIVNAETGCLCAPDELGEIWVAGPGIAAGYWNRTEESAKAFQGYIQDTHEGPFLRTGDLGYVAEGELFITGRIKDLIILAGRNLYPPDIEHIAECCNPALSPARSAAFSITVGTEEKLVYVVELDRHYQSILLRLGLVSAEASSDQCFSVIQKAIRRAIAENFDVQVYDIVLVETGTIPRTSSGKIQRRASYHAYMNNTLSIVASIVAGTRSL